MKTTKIQISALQRFNLTQILPAEASYSEMILKTDISQKVQLSQVEQTKFIERKNDLEFFNAAGISEKKEIPFSELEINFIKKTLRELDGKKKINDQTAQLYKIFCIDFNENNFKNSDEK